MDGRARRLSEHRTTNSILTAAVVAVYLGLVLAGATPQVFAQAAVAKQFNVRDEIETRDNLDIKPDPTFEELVKGYESYFDDVENLITDLAKLYSIEKFDPNWDKFDVAKTVFSPCPEDRTLLSRNSQSHVDPWLIPALQQAEFAAESWSWLSDCKAFQDPAAQKWSAVRTNAIKLKFDTRELLYKITIEKSTSGRTDSLESDLSRALLVFDVDEDNDIEKVLFANTKISKANDQIFIITLLPRADLDRLLANRS